ncbi:MAG: hypothetical protein J5486_08570 [Bacteroidaceae bacterium]|nr:hypothetical protein [Bacteroidaceae bacterium]
MKKTYIEPKTEILTAALEMPLALSGVTSTDNDISIGYGGVDDSGELDPSVKESSFDFNWE